MSEYQMYFTWAIEGSPGSNVSMSNRLPSQPSVAPLCLHATHKVRSLLWAAQNNALEYCIRITDRA